MNSRIAVVSLCVALSGMLAGCSRQDQSTVAPVPAPATATASAAPAIAWFQGDVEAAFARAKAEGKPVLLYWGAEWCPPCHQLKATVFTRPDFIAKTNLFIPVYLDGDTEGAQKWGDTFRVSGYPTLVVLSADRTELTRIVGGMNLADYDDVLDLVLGDVRPVRVVLDTLQSSTTTRAATQQSSLSRDDCKRLAYNGWALDDSVAKDPQKAAIALERAVDACPADAHVERARLIVAATYASLAADSKLLEAGKPPGARTTKLLDAVDTVLRDPESTPGIRDVMSWLGDDYFKAEQRSNPQRAAGLLDAWTRTADAAANDESLPEADRIDAIALKLRAVKALSPDRSIPQALANAALQRVDASLAKEYPEHARPGVVNSAEWVLDTLDDQARMRSLLEHEISTARQPYYYMLDLADVEEKAGNKDQAIALLERAYRESQGAATRFQWGTNYVTGLVRMRPEDGLQIRDATLAVLSELDGPDRIYMRTAARLKRLDSTLRDWNAKGAHKAELHAIRERVDEICGRIPAEQSSHATCNEFLTT
jgi:thiol-disulfide isomerase/thioredoxin